MLPLHLARRDEEEGDDENRGDKIDNPFHGWPSPGACGRQSDGDRRMRPGDCSQTAPAHIARIKPHDGSRESGHARSRPSRIRSGQLECVTAIGCLRGPLRSTFLLDEDGHLLRPRKDQPRAVPTHPRRDQRGDAEARATGPRVGFEAKIELREPLGCAVSELHPVLSLAELHCLDLLVGRDVPQISETLFMSPRRAQSKQHRTQDVIPP
jgi:hypothetical protein